MELTIAEVQEAVAGQVPDRECVVEGHRRTTYLQFTRNTRRLAAYLMRAGFGCSRSRSTLHPWESGQDHIGLYMHNCVEYLEAEFGVLKARAAAINVNWRYVDKELDYLFRDAALKGVVYQSSFADRVSRLRARVNGLRMLIQVPDESGAPLLTGAVWYADAIAADDGDCNTPAWSPDDLHILYTGGTTGFPKGVLWRQADILMAGLGGLRPDGRQNKLADFLRCADKTASRTLPAGPFMHASGRWPAMAQILVGNTVVLPANTRRLDPDDVWSTAERERIAGINIAGDAFARPLLDQLGRKSYDLSSLRLISSGAAVLSPTVKRELLRLLPSVAISDTIGASETGPQASSVIRAAGSAASPAFKSMSRTTVLSADLSRAVEPGSSEIGWLARSGHVPLGYLGDATRTTATFPVIDGIRYAVPGDRARWKQEDEIELLGRDAATINSGGEKVFAEEVEVALKHHGAVYDAIVCGRPSAHWGQEVVAVVSIRRGMRVSEEELLTECSKHIARYKLPKAFIFTDEVARTVSGKPDYEWARAQALAGVRRNES